MSEPIPYDAHRFRNAAAHYTAGRPPYSPALIRRVAELTRLRPTYRLLDLGCGPGMLALAFAPYVAEVIGMDPEPEMLRQAEEQAEGTGNVRFVRGSSYELEPSLGAFRLVVMGRSFHWMDRPETLRRLDAMIEPDGLIALFGDTHPDVPDNAWREPYRAVLDRYSGGGRDGHRTKGWVRHEAVLLDSAFSCLEAISVIERRRTDLDTLIRRALSQSSLAAAHRSGRTEDLANELDQTLRPFMPDGLLTEVVSTYALLARRP